MSVFFLLYVALLLVWPLLLWPAWRLRGWAGLYLALVAAAGCAAVAREVWLFLGTSSAIRIDILLISFVLVVLYVTAAVVLAYRRWHKLAGLLGMLVTLLGAGMAHQWSLAGGEAERLRQLFQARNALMFEAGFRSHAAYETAYGPFVGPQGDHPVGHWLAEAEGRFSRLIINAEGAVWAFYRCDDTECIYGSEGEALRRLGEMASWQINLSPTAGEAIPIVIRLEAPERVALTAEGSGEQVLTSAPPPIIDPPAPEALEYLGPFSAYGCSDGRIDLQQLWLWRDRDRLFAVGVFTRALAGQRHDFILPLVLGEARFEDEAWLFEWQADGNGRAARVAFSGDGVSLTLRRQGGDVVTAHLTPGGPLVDPVIARAALRDAKAWREWFEVVLVGHFTSGMMPRC